MRSYLIRFLVFVITLIGLSYRVNVQKKIDTTKLLRSWYLEKHVFLEPCNDSVNIRNESVGSIVIIKKGNSFVTKRRVGELLKVIDTGTYSLDVEGKHFYQNDLEFEIIELTEELFVIRSDEASVELYFKRLKTR